MTARLGCGLLLLGLAACGGNYSNDDVVFREAVPTRDALASKLSGAQAALWDPSGVSANLGGTRGPTGAVVVGDPSGIAQFTVGASEGFNHGLFKILDVLQAVISLEPTQRLPDGRVWGPYPDQQHPGFQVQLVMDRTPDRFDYRVEVRKVGTTGWTKVIAGDFEPAGGGLRRGEGSLQFLDEAARGVGYDLTSSDVATIDVTYQTRTEPITVNLTVTSVSQEEPLLAFGYAGRADGGGQLHFGLTAQLAGGDASPLDTLDILSQWKADGSGRADAEILAGDFVGATYVECWTASQTVLYAEATWSTPVGELASCPVF
jgi:hypothetical protein